MKSMLDELDKILKARPELKKEVAVELYKREQYPSQELLKFMGVM